MPTTHDMQGYLRTGRLAMESRRDKDSATWTRFRQDLDALQLAVEDFANEEAAIRADIALSEKGKIDRLATAAQKKSVQLAWLWKRPKEQAEAETRLSNLLYSPVKRPSGDPVLQFLREKELRDDLKGNTQSQIDGVYYEAIASGKDELLRALLDGPGGPMPSDGARTEMAVQQAKATNPTAFQELADLREMTELLHLMVGRAATWLKKLGANLENKADVVMA